MRNFTIDYICLQQICLTDMFNKTKTQKNQSKNNSPLTKGVRGLLHGLDL